MDRRALLLYLQNVRDLEVVRERIRRTWDKDLTRLDRVIITTQTKPEYRSDPPEYEEQEGNGCLAWFLAFLAVLIFLFTPGGGFPAFFISLLFAIPAYKIWPGRKIPTPNYEQRKQEVQADNIRQDEIAKEGQRRVEKIENQKAELNSMYQSQYDKATGILRRFYAMNILPNSYRNLASVY